MSKNLLNYYRYRRKLGKKIEQVKHDLHDVPPSVHDVTWRANRKRNPFAQDDPYATLKHRIAFFVIFVCVSMVAGLILYHPFFHISQVMIFGTERINKTDIEKAIEATISYKKWYIFPMRSFFLADVNEIRDVLVSRFPLSDVEVKKTFPHHLSLHINEKISTIIYDNGKQYSYIGLDGKIVEVLRAVGDDEWKRETKTVTSTAPNGDIVVQEEIISAEHILRPASIKKEMGNYPIVYDRQMKDGGINSSVLDPQTVRGIVAWFQYLSTYANVPFNYVEIDHEFGDAVIYTDQGWHIKVRLAENVDAQFEVLQVVLAKQVDHRQVQYIDVRFPGKVYWR